MDDKRFWDIIAVGCSPHASSPTYEWGEGLLAELSKLGLDELLRFKDRFDELTDRAYRRDLWSVAALLNGGASDDGFYYFRCWLVGMGKQVYEAALACPDSLADVTISSEEGAEAEIYSVAIEAWRQQGGDDEEYERARASSSRPRQTSVQGEDLDFDDPEVRRRFPRLTARYLSDEGPQE